MDSEVKDGHTPDLSVGGETDYFSDQRPQLFTLKSPALLTARAEDGLDRLENQNLAIMY
jgi:hypothetical protein